MIWRSVYTHASLPIFKTSAVRWYSSRIPESSKLSWMLLPTKKQSKQSRTKDNSNAKIDISDMLIKAGYIHQSSSGIYTLMPMAQRVMEKIEKIIDEEMKSVGGQKLTMPTLLTPDNWKKTGRLSTTGDELFQLKDRRDSTFILGPTHEEEITAIAKETVRSHRQLPLRLYQTTRKFRDEARPRAGLLRAREFVMKDMYSFDKSAEAASATFAELERAYRSCFDRIGVSYAVAEADSGNIGGALSKEFHFINEAGEDTLLRCGECGYTANDERARGKPDVTDPALFIANVVADKRTMVPVAVPAGREPSVLKLKQEINEPGSRIEIEPLVGPESASKWAALMETADVAFIDAHVGVARLEAVVQRTVGPARLGDWHVAESGDACVKCGGRLSAHRAIEVAHIFCLGSKYSRAMDLAIEVDGAREFVQMGCYGIGVSRVLQAAAECSTADTKGLRWPPAIAPYICCVVPLAGTEADVERVFEALESVRAEFKGDVAVDDRKHLSAGFRLNDAQLLGFPLLVVLGRRFVEVQEVEVQVRVPRTSLGSGADGAALETKDGGLSAFVHVDKLAQFIANVV